MAGADNGSRLVASEPMSDSGHEETAWSGLAWIHVEGYRTLLDCTLRPGPMCALVGETNTGKSNLLAAVRTLLDPKAAPLLPDDPSGDGREGVVIRGRLSDGTEVSIDEAERDEERLPAAVFLPAKLRSGPLVAPSRHPRSGKVMALFERALDSVEPSTTRPAMSLLDALEGCCEKGVTETVLLIEEPELFLSPLAGRYLCRLLRRFAALGNQVIYSTHSPALLNVARIEELAVTERHPELGTRFTQPAPHQGDEAFRARSEFDAERSELFLARAVILVEGMTEKLVLPFVFEALGHDPDQELISVVECGGKSNIPLFVDICKASGIPSVVMHDRDAPEGEEPSPAEQQLNELIMASAGADNTVQLVPDFEGVAGLRGRRDKVARAWRWFRELAPEEVPDSLSRVVKRAMDLAHERAMRSPVRRKRQDPGKHASSHP